MEAQRSGCLHAAVLCTQGGHTVRDLGTPGLKGWREAWDQSLTGPRGQRVSVGVSPELRARGTFSKALSEPPSSTIYMGYTGMRGLVE